MFVLKNNKIKLSVRSLVEFIFRQGDITTGKSPIASEKSMEAGTRIHKKIQKNMPLSYQSEVTLKTSIKLEGYEIVIEGRADGIDKTKNGILIDEIKGTYRNLEYMKEPDYVHLAQAMCYGHMYLKDHKESAVTIQITYCNLDTEEIKRFQEVWTREDLEQWFSEMITSFQVFTDLIYQFKKEYISSAKDLSFPFSYRMGQKEMTAAVYYAIREKKKMFVQAPTGVGKTMSTLFPAVKALGEEKATRIFYLTAKNITGTVAEESMKLLQKKGLSARFVTITAKDKLCVCEKRDCNPAACERAKGHYDRVNQALYHLMQQEIRIDRETILSYAERYQVCPYELCLDASGFSEMIICDYNYAFDWTARLKRYFQGGKGDYIFLIDETHNLVERSREMYSSTLRKSDFLALRKQVKEKEPRLAKRLFDTNQKMLDLKKKCNGLTLLSGVDSLSLSLLRLKGEMERILEEDKMGEEKDAFLELYFSVIQFAATYETIDDCYQIYGEEMGTDFLVKLYCIQPCNNLALSFLSAVSVIFFSATILPIEYYKNVLCGNKEEMAVYIPSPFPKEHRLLMVAQDVSSLYSKRGYGQYYRVYLYIISALTAKKGNYIVFFPSYQYMEEVVSILYEEGYPSAYDLLVQKATMLERDKEDFLNRFDGENPVCGCCVLGGMFSEGIDLTGDRLIGSIIVGTGLPKVTRERNLLRDYYEEKGEQGFSYAYLYPGMNKVLQAAGRVIRTASDQGMILLLDDRFLREDYQELFPREWTSYRVVNQYNVKQTMLDFWAERERDSGSFLPEKHI